MLRLTITASLLVLWIGSSGLADDSKEDKEKKKLRHEIQRLKRHEAEKIKKVRDRYNAILKKKDKPEDRLERERDRLAKEEKAALRDVKDSEARKRIRADFDKLRADISKQIKKMEHELGQIARKRDAEIAKIKAEYRPRIDRLEDKLEKLEKAQPTRPKKKK